jgi:hypothetical protein
VLHALASMSPLTVFSSIGVVVLSLLYGFVLRAGGIDGERARASCAAPWPAISTFITRRIQPRSQSPSTPRLKTSGAGSCRWGIDAAGCIATTRSIACSVISIGRAQWLFFLNFSDCTSATKFRWTGTPGFRCRPSRRASRSCWPVSATVGAWLFMRAIEPAAFVMTRKMLLGIKRRAEGGRHMRRSSIAALWLLLLFVTTGGVVLARQTGRANPPLVPDTMYGPDLYRFYCAPCHGRDGKGHGPVAASLKTMPSDLTQIAKRNGGVFPSDRVEVAVTNGLGAHALQVHGTPEMPVWGPVFRSLDPSDARVQVRIANLIAYLDAIQAK